MSDSGSFLLNLFKYLEELKQSYLTLMDILAFEQEDILAGDQEKLCIHTDLEKSQVEKIISYTKTCNALLFDYKDGSLPQNSEISRLYGEIDDLRKQASERGEANIVLLSEKMSALKNRIERSRLPKFARRIYYSGDNPNQLDIKI